MNKFIALSHDSWFRNLPNLFSSTQQKTIQCWSSCEDFLVVVRIIHPKFTPTHIY